MPQWVSGGTWALRVARTLWSVQYAYMVAFG